MSLSEAITFALLLTMTYVAVYWAGIDRGRSQSIEKRGAVVRGDDPCWCGALSEIGPRPRVFDGREHTRGVCLKVRPRV